MSARSKRIVELALECSSVNSSLNSCSINSDSDGANSDINSVNMPQTSVLL